MSYPSYSAPSLCATDEVNDIDLTEQLQIYRDKYGRSHPSEISNDEAPSAVQEDETTTGGEMNGEVSVGASANDGNNEQHQEEINELVEDQNNNEQLDENEAAGGDEEEEADDNEEDADVPMEILGAFFEELERIPLTSKLAYVEALIQVPELVETESDPVGFLRYTNYNPAAAARGLCEYWKRRVEIFGDEDAFKPMTLDGACHGIIKTVADLPEFFRVLPNDEYGRAVLSADRTHVDYKGKDPMDFVKYFWLIYHESLCDPSTQKNGFVVIVISRGVNYNYLSRKAIKYIFNHALPLKPCCVHFCFSSLSSRMILPVMKYFMKLEGRRRLEVHTSVKTPTVLSELREFGLLPENLPQSVGGTFKELPRWVVECRQIIESDRKRRNQQPYSNRWERLQESN